MSPAIGIGIGTCFRSAAWPPTNFLAIGQSNMAAAPPNTLGWSAMRQYLGADLRGWDEATGALVQLVDGFCNLMGNPAGEGLGSGPAGGQIMTLVMRRQADALNKTVNLFGHAYSGQPIDYFLPSSATKAHYSDGTQHATLNNYNLLKSCVAASGETIDCIVMCQGEADAGSTEAAYRAKLDTLIAAWRSDYKGARIVIITTISATAGGGTIAGVRAAQIAACAANPSFCYLVDTTDMEANGAWFGPSTDTNHYTSYAGFEEVAERVYTAIAGLSARPDVAAVEHVDDVMTPDGRWQYVHSIIAPNTLAVWGPSVSLNPMVTVTNSPTHVINDANLGARHTAQFAAASTQSMKTNADLPGTSDKWTIFLVTRQADIIDNSRVPFELCDSLGKRLAFRIDSGWGEPEIMVDAIDHRFNGGAGCPRMNTSPHSIIISLDSDVPEIRYYLDGVLTGTYALGGAMTLTTPRLYVGAQLGVASYMNGTIGCMAVAAGHAADAADAAALHDWAEVEFKL